MPPPLTSAACLDISLRPARADELDFLGAVYASTRTEEIAQAGWPPEMEQAFLKQQHEAQHAHYASVYPDAERLVIERGGERIGRLYLQEWTGNVRIVDIALLPHARRGGVGEAMVRDIAADAWSRGRKVSIHVETFNPARRLYERLGFVGVEDKGVYQLMEWCAPGEAGGAADA